MRWKFSVILTWGNHFLVISDFPSSNYAKFYLTKRKSVKNASGSSHKLISYSPIFASFFRSPPHWAILSIPKHFLRSFVWSNKILHNYLKESQKSLKNDNPTVSITANCHRILPITFDGFYIFLIFFALCVISRRLLILRARYS